MSLGIARDRAGRSCDLTTIWVALAAAGLWILSRPFTFVENDGKLYAFMALARLAPGTLGQDLFVRFGSQDSYSLFSPLYAQTIRLLGFTGATVTLLFASAVLWLAGCWRLARSLLSAPRARVALVVFACVRLVYGGGAALYLGQGVLTSRILAEALVLLALAEAARGAWHRGGPLLVLAALMHPLMAAGGAATALMAEGIRRPRLALPIMFVALCGLVGGWLATPPLRAALSPMSADWLAIVQRQNGFIFLSSWTPADWGRTVAQLATVALAARRTRDWPRRFFMATMLTAVGGLIACFVGADLLHIALVIQLQLWRAVWPLAWACVPALIVLVPTNGERTPRDQAAWVVPALLTLSIFGLALGWPYAGLALVAVAISIFKIPMPRLLATTLVILAVFLLLLALALPILNFLTLNARLEHPLSYLAFLAWLQSLFRGLLAPFAGLAFILIARNRPSLAPFVAGALFLFSAVTWDQRLPWERNMMAPAPLPAARGPILWGLKASPAWFMFHQSAYVSLEQSSGLPFSARATRLWQARVDRSEGIVNRGLWWSGKPVEACADEDPPLSAARIASICAGVDPPGAIVSGAPALGYPATMFETPADRLTLCLSGGKPNLVRTRRFYLSRCDAPPNPVRSR